MKVRRDFYLKQLEHRMHDGLVKVVTGVRRCGKSYLLSVLFRDFLLERGVAEDHIIEVPLDRDEFRSCRDAIALGEYIRSKIVPDGRWTYVFVDEIQLARKVLPPDVDPARLAPEDRERAYVTFVDTLNGLRQTPNVDVYVTGSNSRMLSSDIETDFADRGTQIRVHPFSFAEYCDATGAADKAAALDRYLVWGGMPLAVAETDDRLRARYLEGLFREVYVSDIRKRYRLRDDGVLGHVLDAVASATGSLTNPHKLVDTLRTVLKVKTNDHTVRNYLGYLQEAFLFSEAKRWDVKGRRYFDFPMKYYCEDTGLRNARLGFRDTDPSHAMENAIYNELVRRGCSVDVGVVPIVALNAEGRQELRLHEIDFVVNRAPGKLYIQSAFAMPTPEKREQELLPLRRSGDFFRKMVVVAGTAGPRVSDEGIVHVGIVPFLLDPSILDNALAD
jgi:hypothetical protein